MRKTAWSLPCTGIMVITIFATAGPRGADSAAGASDWYASRDMEPADDSGTVYR